MGDVANVYLWANGMLMVFGHDGEQIPDLQGRDNPERRQAILARSDHRTKFNGLGNDGPCVWPQRAGDQEGQQ